MSDGTTSTPDPNYTPTDSTSERRDHLFLIVDHLIEVHAAWSADDDIPYLTAPFEQAVNETIELFKDGSIPGDCRDLWHAVERMEEYWSEYLNDVRHSANQDQTTPLLPNTSFWKAFEQIQLARAKADPLPAVNLEPIADLRNQKVSDNQICLIYGFQQANGAPNLRQLHEEIAEPGKHTSPATGYLSPIERERQQAAIQQQEIIESTRRRRQEKIEQARQRAKPPESLPDLIEQGVSGDQICSLLSINPQQLAEQCEQLNIPIPQHQYDSPQSMRAPQERDVPEETLTALDAERARPTRRVRGKGKVGVPVVEPELELEVEPEVEAKTEPKPEPEPEFAEGEPLDDLDVIEQIQRATGRDENLNHPTRTIEQQIIIYNQQVPGLKPGQIAKQLSIDNNTRVTSQKVGKTLKRFERNPEKFGL